MTYERTIAAAVAETKSKFALAEALAEDIPPRRPGPSNDASLLYYLDEARQAITHAGGESRSVETLRQYRNTALWVQVGNHPNYTYRWAPGASFTAHREAQSSGMTYDTFSGLDEQTRPGVLKRVGRGHASVNSPSAAVSVWTPEQKAEAARELLSQPEVAERVVYDNTARENVRRALDERYEQAPKPYPTQPAGVGNEPFELLSRFRKVHVEVDAIVQLILSGRAVVNDTERDALLKETEWLEAAAGTIKSGLSAGSLDQALRAFQEEWLS